jgi:hypothetical protein
MMGGSNNISVVFVGCMMEKESLLGGDGFVDNREFSVKQ